MGTSGCTSHSARAASAVRGAFSSVWVALGGHTQLGSFAFLASVWGLVGVWEARDRPEIKRNGRIKKSRIWTVWRCNASKDVITGDIWYPFLTAMHQEGA